MFNIYECKNLVRDLGDNCHNTKNRIIEKMSELDKKDCKILGNYLQCLMVIESLSSYICVCCCEHETLSQSIISELKQKCKDLIKKCNIIKKNLDNEICEYINCNEITNFCEKCINLNKKKRTKKKK